MAFFFQKEGSKEELGTHIFSGVSGQFLASELSMVNSGGGFKPFNGQQWWRKSFWD